MYDSSIKLQRLAAKSVCVQLVHEWAERPSMILSKVWEPRKGYGTCKLHNWYLHHMSEIDLSRRFANIRNIIRYLLEDTMALICERVVFWVQCHHSIKFFHDDEESTDLRQYIKKLVWNRDFEIDYRATAENILTNDKLSLRAKFRFACTYCIFEEIQDIYYRIESESDSEPRWDLMEEPFMAFWSKYISNNDALREYDEEDPIPEPTPEDFREEMITFIINSGKIELWPVAEYVFDSIDTESKWPHYERMVEVFGERYSYLKNLLVKLTDKELKLNLVRHTTAISAIFEKIVQLGTVNEARLVWKLCRSEMSSENFCGILETLVPSSMKNTSDFQKWTPLLIEIWTNAIASCRFRQFALDTELWRRIGEKFILNISDETEAKFRASRQISEPMKFIRTVLRCTDVKNRMAFFEKNFHWLVLWAPFTEVDKLIRDFLERFNRDVANLKKIIANSSEVESSVCKLLGYREFDDFDAVLSFYLPGVDGVVRDDEHEMQNSLMCCKRKLMESSNGESHLCLSIYYGDWRPLYEYVKKTFSQAHITPKAFMIKLLKIGELLTHKMDKCEMNDLKKCLSTVLSCTDPKFKALKERYKNNMFGVLFDYDDPEEKIFNRARLQEFLLWVYNGNEELIDENFKQLNLLRLGFVVQLKFCIVEDSLFRVTNSMKEYLEWCFATEAERKRFKRDMIYKFRDYDLFDDMLARRRYRQSMLLWFFDDDDSLIEKFMTVVFKA